MYTTSDTVSPAHVVAAFTSSQQSVMLLSHAPGKLCGSASEKKAKCNRLLKGFIYAENSPGRAIHHRIAPMKGQNIVERKLGFPQPVSNAVSECYKKGPMKCGVRMWFECPV